MKLLSFVDETPAAALKKAQEACGEDALVFSTKEIRKKTLTTPAVYEVIVGVQDDQQNTGQSVASTPYQKNTYTNESSRNRVSEKDDVVVSMSTASKQMSRIDSLDEPNINKYESLLKKDILPESVKKVPSQTTPSPSERSQQPSVEITQIKKELDKLNDNIRHVGQMVWDSGQVARGGLVVPPEFAEIYKITKDSGMSEEHLFEIMRITLENMPRQMKENPGTVKRYFDVLLRRLIPVRVEMSPVGKKTIMLIGPTGVGKTTTLAKLAARFAYKSEKKYKVGIITMDTYRIGAVEQLLQYAKMMKLSIEAVVDPTEFKSALSSLRYCDYVLIDTAGSSQYDREKINKIARFLKTENSTPIDTCLVMSANTKYEDLKEIYEGFANAIPIDSLILTKLDETKYFGNTFSFVYDTKKPIAYFSTGQEVPEDLIEASSEFFVECLLDGFKARTSGK
jgi:flagellar biosynthesis protein FlhF